ncbi:DUF6328 family protein [Tessaracoccus rhinocerotis]|uniref:DUF6328 family protein n=1 Tax=Tessaracoccus rhinocerotis TaxID=1689449 RepID=UPI00163D97A4|nr:DUF6328 family protein [Tessaracoccus rhinocerotis]
MSDDRPTGPARRHETPGERLDRNWGELLQEFRVAQTGIQILFGFLLILPFQAGFSELNADQRRIYLLVFACMTVSTVCILAPVAAHRLLFRKQLKDELVKFGGRLAKTALAFLAGAFTGAVGLIVSIVVGPVSAWVSAGATLAVIVVLWLAIPLTALRTAAESSQSRAEG